MEKLIYQGEQGLVKHNLERNLVEIYFSDYPSRDTIEALKVLRWRYFGKKRCWYNRYDPENIQLAKSICGEAKSAAIEKIDYYISPTEVLVVTSIRSFIYREHFLTKGTASINVLRNGCVKETTNWLSEILLGNALKLGAYSDRNNGARNVSVDTTP